MHNSFIIIGSIYIGYCEIDMCLKLLDESHPIKIPSDSQSFASFSEENVYEEVPSSQGLRPEACYLARSLTKFSYYLDPIISVHSRIVCKIRADACFSRVARLALKADDVAGFTREVWWGGSKKMRWKSLSREKGGSNLGGH
jgi:hypothetical protein